MTRRHDDPVEVRGWWPCPNASRPPTSPTCPPGPPGAHRRRARALHRAARRGPRPLRDIEALDLADVEPDVPPLPLRNVLRDDVVGPTLDRDEVLAAAPAAEDGRFRVPPILGEEP